MSDLTGRFLWFEIMTTDTDGAKAFYSELLGWKAQNWEGGSGMEYTMLLNGETPVGGLMALPEEAKAMGAPPQWMGYVGTPDVDGVLAAAKEAGGGILSPQVMDIPNVGRFAPMKDGQGAVISPFCPAEAPKDELTADTPVGAVSWRELATTDLEAATAFYSAQFGWETLSEMDMGPGGTYRMFGKGGVMLGGMFTKPDEMPQSCWLYYFKVADLDAAVERATRMGGTLLNGPMEVPGGDRIAQLVDPQGAAFALHWANPNPPQAS